MKRLGAILAGGRASRFGSDKALAQWRGRALIDHAVAALLPAVDAVVICGRPHGDWPWVSDRPAPELGPLGGLCAALAYAGAHGFDRVVTLPCDVPLAPAPLLDDLCARAPAFLDAMPVIGGWPAQLAPALDAFIAGGSRAMRAWASHVGAEAVQAAPPPNINYLADLAALDNEPAAAQ